MKKKYTILIAVLLVSMLVSVQSVIAQYTIPSKMNWWYEARFGMFIHFGSYSQLAHGEWAFATENWTKTNYQTQVSALFNPTNFNAGTIARLAKKAGMKYLVITAKHHEGFCMWQTSVLSFKDVTGTKLFDLPDFTAFKTRDILKELKDSCDVVGVKFCLYYSILDWDHPSQTIYQQNFSTMASMAARTDYINDMKAQLSELITKYHPGILWFDGDWTNNTGAPTLSSWWTKNDGIDLYNYLIGLDPNLLVNERVFRGAGLGDWMCPEQTVPASPEPRPWETNQTMNGSWGYNAGDNNYKSTTTLIRQLVQVVSRDGNYLLNIGPKGDGSVPSQSVTILNAFGDWMNVFGQSIYGTTRSPYTIEPTWGYYTKKSGKLFAHVFTWPPNKKLKVPSLTNTINKIYVMNDSTTLLNYTDSIGYLWISLPATAPNPINSVVVIDVPGVPAASTQYVKVSEIVVRGTGGADNISVIGGTLQMLAIITPSSATEKTVNWTVSDTSIVSISASGLITANKNGSVTVTATSKDGSDILGRTTVTVGKVKQGLNLIQNSDFETQGAWIVTQCDPNGSVNPTFGASGTGPQAGSGKFLELTFAGNPTTPSSQIFVYQKIVIKRGHTYKFSAAMKDASSSLIDDWISIAWVTDKPTARQDIAEKGLSSFGSWQACNGVKFDGLIDASCATYQSGTTTPNSNFTIPATLASDTIYFGINLGTWGITSNIDLYFDNVSLVDASYVKVTGVTITGQGGASTITSSAGSLQLSAAILPANASEKAISWSVSDTSLAFISTSGLLTAKKNGAVTVTATSEDDASIQGTLSITISGQQPNAVREIYNENKPYLFPNPVEGGILYIKQTENLPMDITIYNVTGQLILSQKMEGKILSLDISALSPGVYSLKASDKDEVITQKFIKN